MSRRFFRFILFITLVVLLGLSGITTSASVSVSTDTTKVVVRQPDARFVESYRSQKSFSYTQPPFQPGIVRQVWNYLVEKLGGWTKISKAIPLVFKILIVILFIIFVFLAVVKTQVYKVLYSDNRIVSPDFKLSAIDDQLDDFDDAIRLQIAQKQYRFAIRLLYLKVINQLRIKEYIHFSKEKTNVDYLHDLNNDELKSGFYTITSIYNRVWYGDFEITEDQFLRFEQRFLSFYTAIDGQK